MKFLILFSLCVLMLEGCETDKTADRIRKEIGNCCDREIDDQDISIEKKVGYYLASTKDDQTKGFYFLGHVVNNDTDVIMIDNSRGWIKNDSINKSILAANESLYILSLHINDVYIDSAGVSLG